MTKYGDHFLQVIRKLSQGLNLSLDGEEKVPMASLQTKEVTKVSPLTNKSKKLTSAKFEAWKMWHEDGLSIYDIAVCRSNLLLLIKIYTSQFHCITLCHISLLLLKKICAHMFHCITTLSTDSSFHNLRT